MSFISLNFVVLFACTFILYHTLPSRFRKATLLTASCLFIGFYHLTFLITALILTLTTFYLGKWIGQTKRESSMKGTYFSGVCFLVVSWLAFRYADRLTDCHILFPLGISFYTFQAISYLTEIYWQEEEPEKSLPDFMIYMLFFMKFLSGPIERAGDMLPQLKSCKATDYASMVYGMRLIVVGLNGMGTNGVKLYAVLSAISPVPQSADKFKDGIKRDPADILSIWMGIDYLNIMLEIKSQNGKHSFHFIEDEVTTDKEAGTRTVRLSLYHDDGGDVQAYTKRAYASVPLRQYAEDGIDKVTIYFSLNTYSGKEVTYEFEYNPQ